MSVMWYVLYFYISISNSSNLLLLYKDCRIGIVLRIE